MYSSASGVFFKGVGNSFPWRTLHNLGHAFPNLGHAFPYLREKGQDAALRQRRVSKLSPLQQAFLLKELLMLKSLLELLLLCSEQEGALKFSISVIIRFCFLSKTKRM